MENDLRACREASVQLRRAGAEEKNRVLRRAAALLVERQSELIEANRRDLEALDAQASPAFRDRLTLNDRRILQMKDSLEQVAALEDPVSETVEEKTLANGLRARRVRSPLGVIFMIFESRPNVAIEAFSLAFKAGNGMILRGGKESKASVAVLYDILRQALVESGFSPDLLWGITDPDRALVARLLQQRRWIDVVVPRGGDRLIEFVVENSRIPIIKNDRGMCHIYVHSDANLGMAVDVCANAKAQRPGVCNAAETFLVNAGVAKTLIPALYERLSQHEVSWYGDRETCAILDGRLNVHAADAASWDTEYLDYKVNCRVVDTLEQAIRHIEEHGSRHSEAILTESGDTARRFQDEVDAAAVYWNASTRFTDGYELGLGGELGISTQKLHVRGPVGLRELTSVRWMIDGNGQVRQ